jgi:DNA-binding transcriptional MerR regulator
MRIGTLAELAGTPAETIRYYERIGLLAPPERSVSNYRQYARSHVERLQFVRRCRSLDISIADVRVLLAFRDAPERNCAEVNEIVDEHLAHVEQHIEALQRKRAGNSSCPREPTVI